MTATTILESPVIADWEPGKGDLVETVGLLEAAKWNGKKGVVVQMADNDRCLVRFQVPKASDDSTVDNNKKKNTKKTSSSSSSTSTRKKIKPENLIAYCPPLENDPRVAFLVHNNDQQQERHMVQIANGKGQHCVECDLDLDGEYFVACEGKLFCEEHFVANYITKDADKETFVRWCPLCHEYIPIRDGVALPPTMFEEGTVLGDLHPNGKLPDGRSLAFDNSIFGEDEPYWAHRECFECCFCGKPFWDIEMTPHGFQIQLKEKEKNDKVSEENEDNDAPPNSTTTSTRRQQQCVAEFHCASKPGTNDGCAYQHEKRAAALQKLNEYESMTSEQLCSVLTERNIPFDSDNDDVLRLIQKCVVTDSQGHFSTSGRFYERRATIKHSVLPSSCIVIPPPSVMKYGESVLLMGPEAPGALLLNPTCRHGSQMAIWDTRLQREKRNAVAEFILSHRHEISNGRLLYTSFHMACSDTVRFFTEDPKRYKLLKSDIHDKFIPKVFWCGAVEGAVTVNGGCDYVRMTVAASLIIHAMLTALEAEAQYGVSTSNLSWNTDSSANSESAGTAKEETFSTLSASLSNLLMNQASDSFDGILEQPVLAEALKTINTTAHNLFEFMDHPDHRECDCLEYVATAASLGDTVRISKGAEKAN